MKDRGMGEKDQMKLGQGEKEHTKSREKDETHAGQSLQQLFPTLADKSQNLRAPSLRFLQHVLLFDYGWRR